MTRKDEIWTCSSLLELLKRIETEDVYSLWQTIKDELYIIVAGIIRSPISAQQLWLNRNEIARQYFNMDRSFKFWLSLKRMIWLSNGL